MNNVENLSEEQLLEQKKAGEAAAATLAEDEAFEAQLVKRFGAGSKDLVKKEEPPAVLTAEEKAAADEKTNQLALSTGLEQGWVTKGLYDGYQEVKKTDKLEIARKRFVRENPTLGEKAAGVFNSLYRLDEDDDNEGDDEIFAPNEAKKAARLLAEKMADEEINDTYNPVIKLTKRYDEHVAAEKQRKINQELINTSIAAIPAEMKIKVGEQEYSVTLSPEEIAQSHKIFGKEELQKKGLTKEEITGNAALFLRTTHLERIIQEITDVAVETALDRNRRGISGVAPVRKMPAGTDAMTIFAKEKNLI